MLSKLAIQSCKQIGRDLRKCAVAPSGGVGALARPQSRLSPAMYTAVHSMSTKKVHRYSWAADRLEQLGEQLIEPEKRELIEVTDEMLHNPPDKIKKMGEEIIDLNLLEINQLINLIQKRLQLSDEMVAAALSGGEGGGGAEAAAPVEAEKPKERDSFSIKISAPVDQKSKIKVIKEVRAITGLGLKEAKELVEKAPVVLKENVKKEEAESFKKLLVDSGAQIELV